MRDQLNLTEIAEGLRRKAERRARVNRVMRYVYWGLILIGFVGPFLFLPSLVLLPSVSLPILGSIADGLSRLSEAFGFLGLAIPLAMVVIVLNGVVSMALIYRDDRERANRANAILPTLAKELPEGQLHIRARIPWVEMIFLVVIAGSFLWGFTTSEIGYTLLILAIILLLIFGRRYRWRLEAKWLYWGPLAQGDYEHALKRVETVLRWMPHRLYYLSAKGFVLFLSGQNNPSEDFYRNILSETRNNAYYLGLFLANVGGRLAEQERYDEAFKILEAAAQITPENEQLYVVLAGAYLREHGDAERALELVEYALANSAPPKSNLFLEGYIWCIRKMLEARAAALTGRDVRANAAMETALAEADPKFLPGLAEINVQAGYMRQSQGDMAAAREHFERAQEIDPNGRAGKLAGEAMTKSESRQAEV